MVHCGEVSAASRDAAFAAVKAKGIRPSSMREAPGFLNHLFGKGKRWMAIGALLISLVAVILANQSNRRTIMAIEREQAIVLPRHQIPALAPEMLSSSIDRLFPDPLDRLLARYAQPGLMIPWSNSVSDAGVEPAADAVAELRGVVSGMRREADGFLRIGRTLSDLETFLKERQRMEAEYRESVGLRVKSGSLSREKANQALSAMGLKNFSRLKN